MIGRFVRQLGLKDILVGGTMLPVRCPMFVNAAITIEFFKGRSLEPTEVALTSQNLSQNILGDLTRRQ
jgi:hypothetical protein